MVATEKGPTDVADLFAKHEANTDGKAESMFLHPHLIASQYLLVARSSSITALMQTRFLFQLQ